MKYRIYKATNLVVLISMNMSSCCTCTYTTFGYAWFVFDKSSSNVLVTNKKPPIYFRLTDRKSIWIYNVKFY